MQADIGKHVDAVYAAAAKKSLSAGEVSSSTVVTCSRALHYDALSA